MDGATISILCHVSTLGSFSTRESNESLLAQTFSDWEGIVLDSCSKIFGAEMPGFMDLPKINITQSWVCEPV
jgi:hypothetical protein